MEQDTTSDATGAAAANSAEENRASNPPSQVFTGFELNWTRMLPAISIQIFNHITLMEMGITLALLNGIDAESQLSGSAVAANWHAVFRDGLSPALLMLMIAADKQCTPTDIMMSSSCRHEKQKPARRSGCSAVRIARAHLDPAWILPCFQPLTGSKFAVT